MSLVMNAVCWLTAERNHPNVEYCIQLYQINKIVDLSSIYLL